MKNESTSFYLELTVDQIKINSSLILFLQSLGQPKLAFLRIRNQSNRIEILCNDSQLQDELTIMAYDDNCSPSQNAVVNIVNGIVNYNSPLLPEIIVNNFTSKKY
jgi:hypothetical protein